MKTAADWQTERRLRALALSQKGWQQNDIAQALGVTKGAVSQWMKRVRAVPNAEQSEALRVRRSTGRPPALSQETCVQLSELVEQGAQAFGFVGAVWTANRVQSVARRNLGVQVGVQVGVTTIKKFLHQAGYSVQKPQVEATQKNEKAVSGFRSHARVSGVAGRT